MRVVHLARKPLTGSVASNVLEHGTGALHIDAARLASPTNLEGEESDRWVRSEDWRASRPEGRWPANLLVEHRPGCKAGGLVKVKTMVFRGKSGQSLQYGGAGRTAQGHDFAGLDGLETVVSWDCEPGCPVEHLDDHSREFMLGRGGPSRFFLLLGGSR